MKLNLGEIDSLLDRAAELPRLEELKGGDILELQRWAKQAEGLVLDLRQALREGVSSEGGMLARRLRALFEERIVKDINGRAVLTTDVAEHSLAVHVRPDGVFVDVRLVIGRTREEHGTAQPAGGT